MRFNLSETDCRLRSVNSRAENHGDQKKPAADISLNCMLPNDELKQFDKTLKDVLYMKPTKGQADMHSLTALRYPELQGPFGWQGEVVGATVTIHRGIDAKSDLIIKNAIVEKFKLEPIQGGSLGVTYSVRFTPENEKQIGRLCMLNGQDLVVTVESPTETEQKKMQKSLLEDDKEAE